MAKRSPASPAQREQIAELRGTHGWSCKRIALHLDMSLGAVAWRCLIDGIEKPGPVPAPVEWSGPMIAKRGNYMVRRFTAAEDRELLRLESESHSRAEIARRLGRAPNTITGRLATLARRDERLMSSQEETMAEREHRGANGGEHING